MTNRLRKTLVVVSAVLIVAVSGLTFWAVWFGEERTGTASSMSDIPVMGRYFGDLQTVGEVHYYWAARNNHHVVYLVVTGTTTPESLMVFCHSRGLRYFEHYPGDEEYVLDTESWLNGLPARLRSRFSLEFSRTDAYAERHARRPAIRYRHSDGRFLMYAVAAMGDL